MKYILGLIAAVAMVVTSNAAVYSTNNLASGTHVVLPSTPIHLQSITLWTTNTIAPTIVKLYDGYVVRTNTAYTNYTVALSSVVSTYITSTGTTNTLTNSVWTTTANPVAAGNVTTDPILTIVVPTASVGPVTWPVNNSNGTAASVVFSRWLIATTDQTGISFVASYFAP